MGNNASFTVIASNGTSQVFKLPIQASEIEEQNPGYFLSDSKNLRVGCRIASVKSDHMLQANGLYFLLSMDLLYSVLTEEEMAAFSSMASNTKKCKRNGGKKIRKIDRYRELCSSVSEEEGTVEGGDEGWKMNDDGDFGEYCRRWKPALATIEEYVI